ncbi:MAG: hypothetical protein EAZ35_08975 [Sphingobacteriia bacterium]|nr:MAG: hypothetical protein EAZ41_09500 [Sphingobacteriia bacterium]TAG29986.1 MAG: hypothetical protein EAZ35_08975 [Sphingobacteriia bacterium]
MKIVAIFTDQLFSFLYDNEKYNEFDRLMDLWTDADYLQAYAKKNKVTDVYGFINDILQDAEQIQDFLDNIHQNKQPYGFYFEPLQESERKKAILVFHKGKIKKNQLRLYAIKLENNCFLITGGAIKMSQKMEEHPDTANELVKLNNARNYLNQNGVFDEDSFFELLSEDI